MNTRHLLALATLLLTILGGTGTALAAAPVNDSRTTPTVLSVPQNVNGTTTGATAEFGEPTSSCEPRGVVNSVWYSLTGVNRRVALTVVAAGDLDAVIDVYARVRSQTTPVDCSVTNSKGIGIVAFKA